MEGPIFHQGRCTCIVYSVLLGDTAVKPGGISGAGSLFDVTNNVTGYVI